MGEYRVQDRFVPKVVDNVLGGNVLLERFLGRAKPWGGGHQLIQPIKYQKSSAGGSYGIWDTFSTSQQNTRVNAAFDPKYNYFSVVLANPQLAVNSGDSKVLDLVSVEMDSVAADMRDKLGDEFYGDGTGNSSKDIIGLKAAVDSGSSITSYAGLLRATYTTWLSDLDSSSNSITLAEMRASFDAAKIGSDAPTIGVTTPAIN